MHWITCVLVLISREPKRGGGMRYRQVDKRRPELLENFTGRLRWNFKSIQAEPGGEKVLVARMWISCRDTRVLCCDSDQINI
ncbi:hypothetical protein DPEC_G00173760 [Dallia pectoralis]|uniref:Uncharacterized protein n=1 Tax=Dallia pectoralis TaxID=75939 RepID=A0ACC2GE88_DALPE|nr:hypothetical protein DPEC_G00173760 [Dallia pectoralis]